MKKIFLMLIIVVFAFACNNPETKDNTKSKVEEIAQVDVVNFEKMAVNLVGKKIEITATISHICKHGGKRMFLVDTETEESVKVVVGENMAAFNTDMEGNTVKVTGIVDELRIDEAYLLEWENEIQAEIEHEKSEAEHTGGGHVAGSKGEEADQGDHISAIESIANYRKEIAESGTDHLSFFSIVCEKYELVKPTEN
jgi:hypothetical protein